jgi:hypothetical protein
VNTILLLNFIVLNVNLVNVTLAIVIWPNVVAPYPIGSQELDNSGLKIELMKIHNDAIVWVPSIAQSQILQTMLHS